MIKAQAPCKDCGDRAIGCHGKCERYSSYRAEAEEEKKTRRKIIDDSHTTSWYEYGKQRRKFEAQNHGRENS